MYKYSSYIVVGRNSDGRYIRKKVNANSLAEFERKKFAVKKEYESILQVRLSDVFQGDMIYRASLFHRILIHGNGSFFP